MTRSVVEGEEPATKTDPVCELSWKRVTAAGFFACAVNGPLMGYSPLLFLTTAAALPAVTLLFACYDGKFGAKMDCMLGYLLATVAYGLTCGIDAATHHAFKRLN